ncbi:MAG: anti-sigma factor family protein, partial [Gemmatimonadota bacterium]
MTDRDAMTSHPDETRLNDHADGLLPADDARAVEAHLAACDACRRRVERLRGLMDELRSLPREIAPPRDLRPPVPVPVPAPVPEPQPGPETRSRPRSRSEPGSRPEPRTASAADDAGGRR